jgi:hypothetical protein
MGRVDFLSQPGGLSTSPQPSLFPSLKNAPLPVKIFVLLKFLEAGVVGSLFSEEDYVRSFVEAVKFAALKHPEAEYVRSEFSAPRGSAAGLPG